MSASFVLSPFQNNQNEVITMYPNVKPKDLIPYKRGSIKSPRRLPTITLKNGKTYFVDNRLRELRNVDNPNDSLDFRDVLQSKADLLERKEFGQ